MFGIDNECDPGTLIRYRHDALNRIEQEGFPKAETLSLQICPDRKTTQSNDGYYSWQAAFGWDGCSIGLRNRQRIESKYHLRIRLVDEDECPGCALALLLKRLSLKPLVQIYFATPEVGSVMCRRQKLNLNLHLLSFQRDNA